MLKTEQECIDYIHSLSKFGKKAGLDNIRVLCERLGNPHKKIRAIHIAGTNGKGSVSCMISEILKTQYKVGLYTSPYIEVFNERIQINGNNISEKDLISYTNRVKDASESIEDFYPIEFEFITAMGFLFFAEQNCDVVVLETGLGGRFDSTNIIENPLCCVICAIGLDHVAILGDTIEKIAFEKAGIIKQNTPVVLYHDMDKSALAVIENVCAQKDAPVVSDVSLKAEDIRSDIKGSYFIYKGNEYNLSMTGQYQVNNALTAIDAVNAVSHILPLAQSDIRKGLEKASWKCRFEVIQTGEGMTILDGAHNCHGISNFMRETDTLLGDLKKTFVFGMLNDKDFEDSAQLICSKNADIVVTDVPSLRQTDVGAVYKKVLSYCPDAKYIFDCHSAYEYALQQNPKGAVCVFGSLYLAGELRKYIAGI